MKKIAFFSVFLLILSLGIIIKPQNTYAAMQNYSTQISAYDTHLTNPFDSGKFLNNTLTLDYSELTIASNIVLEAKVTPTIPEAEAIIPTYEWKQKGKNTILSTANTLTLHKSILASNQNPILIGTSQYILTVTNESTKETDQKVITIKITDQNNLCNLLSYTDGEIPANINLATAPFNICAILPTTAKYKVDWLLKTPNSTKYLVACNENVFNFNPSQMINSSNGYGNYKLIAIATSGDKTYNSQMFNLKINPLIEKIDETMTFEIIQETVKNTKANIEATKFSIKEGERLNGNVIIWYVGNTRMATGSSFVYEPTTKDSYKVTATYLDNETKKKETTLSSVNVSPKATGTWIIYVYIGGAVLVLTAILVTSIIISNKKRDVVW